MIFLKKESWVVEASLLKKQQLKLIERERLLIRQGEASKEFESAVAFLKSNYMDSFVILFEENVVKLRKIGITVVRPLGNLFFGSTPKWKAFIPYE